MTSQLSRQADLSQTSMFPEVKQEAWHTSSENIDGSYLKRLMILRSNLEKQKIEDINRFATKQYDTLDHSIVITNSIKKDMYGSVDVTKCRGCLSGSEPVGRINPNRRSHLDRLQKIREKQKHEKFPPHLSPLRGIKLIGNERIGSRLVASQPAPRIEHETPGSIRPAFSLTLKKKDYTKKFRSERIHDDVLYHIHWMQGGSVITSLPKNQFPTTHQINHKRLNVHNMASSCTLPRPTSSRTHSIFRRPKVRELGRQSLQQVAVLRTDNVVIGEKPSTIIAEPKHRELPQLSTIIARENDLMRKQIIVKLPLLET